MGAVPTSDITMRNTAPVAIEPTALVVPENCSSRLNLRKRFSIVSVKEPADMAWGYTIVSGRPVYNAGTSTQPLWKDMDMNEIWIPLFFNY